MSAPGRPKRESSLGEEAAQRLEGSPFVAPGRPKRESSLGEEAAQRLEGSPFVAPGRPKRESSLGEEAAQRLEGSPFVASHRLLRWLAALLAAAALGAASAQPQASLSEREQATVERAALQRQIRDIEKNIRASEQQRAAAADALRQSEQAISETTRRLAELETEGEQLEAERATLGQRRERLDADLRQRQSELAALLREQYRQGSDSPWSAVLSGDDPHDASRRLSYLGYLARARAEVVQAIAREQAELAEVVQALAARQADWERVQAEQTAQRDERVRQQAERQQVLARIGDQLAVQRTQADRLKSDAERLSDLITDINRALAQQAAERAKREAERRAQAEAQAAAEQRAQAEAERQAAARRAAAEQEAAAAARALVPAPADPLGLRPDEMAPPPPERIAPAAPPAGDTSGPVASFVQRGAAAPVSRVAPPAAAPAPTPAAAKDRRSFAERRGRLPHPVRGTLVARFGEENPAGGTWRGLFFAAASGTPVQAVAPGTVVFSGWLRGFGNLLILDHGDDYLSVYGSNEAILKQVGDAVGAGEAVATAGATGGLAQSGLYFEIRHRGNPVDPLPWTN
ncbi:MAG: murein hydrolase activator EnvC [Pigmentiphaga sp.]